MTDHPFIAAVHAALDTHGLPEGCTVLHIGPSSSSPTGVYCIIDLGDSATSRPQRSLPLAMIAATEARKSHEAKVAALNVARAALVAAGLDPALVQS